MRLFALLSLSMSVVIAQDSERFFDVRKIIKETLDVMRAYPPPSALVQPLPFVSSSGSSGTVQFPQSLPLAQQQQQQQVYAQQNYPQQQSTVYYQQQQQQQKQHAGHQVRYPYRRTMSADVAHQAANGLSNTNNNNNIKYYGGEFQQSSPSLSASVYSPLTGGGVPPAVPPLAAAVPTVAPPPLIAVPTPLPVGRLFASPTQTDVEKLFHLPADILHRLAADAGYIAESESTHRAYPTADNEDVAGYGGYYQMAQQRAHSSSPSPSAGSPGSGFNFNIRSGSDPVYSLQQQKQQPGDSPTTASQPIVDAPPKRNNNATIVAAGNPRIFTRNIMRDGKVVQIPIVAIPQADGRVAYIPFERLSDLSDALAKLVSTGRLSADDVVYGSEGATRAAGQTADDAAAPPPPQQQQQQQFTSNIANQNPFVDQSGDAIATNQVPAQTFRKILPVADLVYPGRAANSPPPDARKDVVEPAAQTLATVSPLPNGYGKTLAEHGGGEKKLADKRDRKLVATASNAFLQEVEEGEEEEPTTMPPPSASGGHSEEIVLNGKRYRLVASDSAFATSDVVPTAAFLKASPTERVQDGGQPIALGDAMASMMAVSQRQQKQQSEPAQPQLSSRIIHQQTEMPSLPYPGELSFPSAPMSSTPGFSLFQQQQMSWPSATVAGVEPEYTTTAPPPPRQEPFPVSFTVVQQQVDEPIKQATAPPIVVNSGAFSRPVAAATAPLTDEQVSHLPSASGEIRRKEPNRSLEKHGTDSTTAIDGRRILTPKNGGAAPLLRQYTLKELEAHYRREYSAAEAMSRAGEADTSSSIITTAASSPTRRVRIGLLSAGAAAMAQDARGDVPATTTTASPALPNNGTLFAESALRKLTRLERLRQQFAQERAAITRRTKALLAQRAAASSASSSSGSPTVGPATTTTATANGRQQQPTAAAAGEHAVITPLTTLHCQNIRRLARQHGTLDVGYFARNNCRLIEQSYAELRCELAEQYLSQCQRYFQSVVSV